MRILLTFLFIMALPVRAVSKPIENVLGEESTVETGGESTVREVPQKKYQEYVPNTGDAFAAGGFFGALSGEVVKVVSGNDDWLYITAAGVVVMIGGCLKSFLEETPPKKQK